MQSASHDGPNRSSAAGGIGTSRGVDLETLQRHVSELAREADAATETYERTAWIKYVAIFVPIPFVVLLFRLQMDAWHYYVAGVLFIAVALAMYALDLAAVAKRDKAIAAIEYAQEAYEIARTGVRTHP